MSERWDGKRVFMRDERRVWTILIEGPEPAIIRAPGSPPITHKGPPTLAQVFSTLDQLEQLLQGLPNQGLRGKNLTPLDQKGPFPECDRCVWLDRDLGVCSEGRPDRNTLITIRGQELLSHSQVARRDWEKCPVPLAEALL